MLVGKPSSYKSFIALDLALTLSSEDRPVLYAAGEGRSGIRKRVKAWEAHHQKTRGAFVLADPVPTIARKDDLLEFISGARHFHPTYALVIVDTLSRSMAGVNENAQEHASMFTTLVATLVQELDTSVLALHHAGHTADRGRGSSVFGADADTIIQLDRVAPFRVSATMTKQKDAEEWTKPRTYSLVEKVTPEGKSLVVTGWTAPNQVAAGLTEAKVERDANANLEILYQIILKTVNEYPGKTWSDKELAAHLATLDEITLKSWQLMDKKNPLGLVALREHTSHKGNVRKMYNATEGWHKRRR